MPVTVTSPSSCRSRRLSASRIAALARPQRHHAIDLDDANADADAMFFAWSPTRGTELGRRQLLGGRAEWAACTAGTGVVL